MSSLKKNALQQYVDAASKLIPLYPPNAKIKSAGKRPIHKHWVNKTFPAARCIAGCEAKGLSVGFPIPPDMVVIDYDVRRDHNGQQWGLFLALATINEREYPKTVTGSNGFHLYMKKPEGLELVGMLDDLESIE